MPKINILSEIMANKIAAGEVVQRPASALKELVENSLDAGATYIKISIKKGGKESIIVMDNGIGMDKEDAQLCLERHATSKIKSDEDLSCIQAYGFRGEALPSIASVSQFELDTCLHGAATGTCIHIDGGEIKSIKESAPINGTCIKVNDLFFNTPARRKFQKSILIEFNHTLEIIQHLALAAHHVSFEFIHDDKEVLKLEPAKDKLERIAGIYGSSLSKELKVFHYDNNSIKINAYLAAPTLTRANRNMQKVFINNRNIKDQGISYAIYQAYAELMPKGRHSIVFLFISMPYDWVDVNVHPAKAEVKFKEETFVYDSLRRALKQGLDSLITQPTTTEPTSVASSIFSYYQKQDKEQKFGGQKTFSYEPFKKTQPVVNLKESASQAIIDVPLKPNFKDFFIFKDTFVITELNDELCIIDQHAAHERVLYERIKKSISQNERASQELLFPLNLNILKSDKALFAVLIEPLTKMGFVIEEFGKEDYVVRAVPGFIKHSDISAILNSLLDEIKEHEITAKSLLDRFDDVIKIMACRAAYKAGDKIYSEELQNIIAELLTLEDPNTCPHGRPVIMRYAKNELEKMFYRK